MRKIEPRAAWTRRGLKRCSSCGISCGQRALICINEECELRQNILATRRPFDPVQLVSLLKGTAFYSLRSKERDAQPRNFVQITEVTMALELHSTILSRNAVCFVDTCKYDSSDATGIACKHVKACSSDPSKPLLTAESYTITREVLWNLNISTEQKNRLWDLYKADEEAVPAVQRINASTFVVKCAQLTKVFPAGRLHVNTLSSKKGTHAHACACKKLKIIVEPDNSVVMQEEICDHLLLVLAAILSNNGKTVYGNFTSALKSFWMPASLETPVVDASQQDAFYGLSINIGGNFGDGGVTGEASADDIFIFGDEFLSDDNIPDFSDIILDLTPNDAALPAQMPPATNTSWHPGGDPNLVSSCCDITEEDGGIQFNELSAAATIATEPIVGNCGTIASTHLELSDCNIELMDQFQLTDQIDLCSDDILPPASTELFDGSNSISILTPPLASEPIEHPMAENSTVPISATATQQIVNNKLHCFNRASLLKSNQLQQLDLPLTTTTLPPIEMPTIAVVKKCPVKASAIFTEVKTRQFPAIPAKRALIVNSPSPQQHCLDGGGGLSAEPGDAESEPSLAYSAWLEYVIESINDSIAIVEQTDIVHNFHVHEEIFSHFSKSFSVGIKRRMPNFTTTVKKGRHKGLIKYTWYFSMASTVRRIFSTKNLSIEIERAFECNKDGVFVPYAKRTQTHEKIASKHKFIYPKLALHMAHIWFDSSNQNHKTGLKLEWLPNAFPKSNFGILNIEFSLGIKHPQKL